MKVGTVYLLHLDSPLGHSRHYMGFSTNVPQRLDRHRLGRGARMLAAAREAGIGFRLVRSWGNVSPSFERRLKRRKEGPRLCPVCNPGSALKNATKGEAIITEEW